MPRTPTFRLLDDRLGGQLLQRLNTWQAADVSCEAMARLLTVETGVAVSGETLRRWLRTMADDMPEAVGA